MKTLTVKKQFPKSVLTLAKQLDFTTPEQYFNYCVESYVNGNKEQCKDLFFSMKFHDRKWLLNYIISHEKYGDIYIFYFNLL